MLIALGTKHSTISVCDWRGRARAWRKVWPNIFGIFGWGRCETRSSSSNKETGRAKAPYFYLDEKPMLPQTLFSAHRIFNPVSMASRCQWKNVKNNARIRSFAKWTDVEKMKQWLKWIVPDMTNSGKNLFGNSYIPRIMQSWIRGSYTLCKRTELSKVREHESKFLDALKVGLLEKKKWYSNSAQSVLKQTKPASFSFF